MCILQLTCFEIDAPCARVACVQHSAFFQRVSLTCSKIPAKLNDIYKSLSNGASGRQGEKETTRQENADAKARNKRLPSVQPREGGRSDARTHPPSSLSPMTLACAPPSVASDDRTRNTTTAHQITRKTPTLGSRDDASSGGNSARWPVPPETLPTQQIPQRSHTLPGNAADALPQNFVSDLFQRFDTGRTGMITREDMTSVVFEVAKKLAGK